MILKKQEAINYVGGSLLKTVTITSIVSLVKTIYDIGKNFGSTIKRLISGTSC